MTIKNKIRMGVLFSVVGLLVIGGITFFIVSQLNGMDEKMDRIHHAHNLGTEIVGSMHEARLNELNFISNNEIDRVEEVEEHVQLMQDKAQDLKNMTDNSVIGVKAESLESSTNSYLNEFSRLVEYSKEIGLSSSQGLTGQMVQNATAFQLLARDANQISVLNEMTSLRNIEKDFINRPRQDLVEDFNTQADTLESAVQSSGGLSQQQAETLSRNLENYRESFLQVSELTFSQHELISKFTDITSVMEADVAAISTELSKEMDAIGASKVRLTATLYVILFVTIGSILAALLIGGFWIQRSIIKSVHTLQDGAKIIGSGNLGFRVHLRTDDEMGDLASTFNEMADQVQRSFREVQRVARDLSSSSETLAAVSEETTAQTHEVNNAIEQVSTGAQSQTEDLERGIKMLGQMVTKLEDVNQSTQKISEQAQMTSSKGNQGLGVMTELDQTSNEFIRLANNLISNVKDVAQSSQKISDIVEAIDEISNSTDLIALNAAIESSRAGEAGKGFAIVAGDVRELAEKTKEETTNIYNVLKEIGVKINSLSSEAETLTSYSSKQGEAVKLTRSSFDDIVNQVQQIEEQVDHVQKSVSLLNHSSQEINSAMQDISAISEESAASAEEVAASSENHLKAIEEVNNAAIQLQDISQLLLREVNKFNLGHERKQQVYTSTMAHRKAQKADKQRGQHSDKSSKTNNDKQADTGASAMSSDQDQKALTDHPSGDMPSDDKRSVEDPSVLTENEKLNKDQSSLEITQEHGQEHHFQENLDKDSSPEQKVAMRTDSEESDTPDTHEGLTQKLEHEREVAKDEPQVQQQDKPQPTLFGQQRRSQEKHDLYQVTTDRDQEQGQPQSQDESQEDHNQPKIKDPFSQLSPTQQQQDSLDNHTEQKSVQEKEVEPRKQTVEETFGRRSTQKKKGSSLMERIKKREQEQASESVASTQDIYKDSDHDQTKEPDHKTDARDQTTSGYSADDSETGRSHSFKQNLRNIRRD
ncbi:HAMP domain-containing methyl-accepting chemotaxis protein [Caldalkalibacillus salinus]|uniref:HAMP domain-containing methyl-accepting chemotaxis protein n=1 Tax=Caldalkalibacillus salinus TaxID=2803787 RepID=UPI0019205131|nr:methyl-accepting chemotaxis protein [Caldalkalibacillus salinus]